MFKKRVHILGTLWRVEVLTAEQEDMLLDKSGYCDPYSKRIVIRDFRAEMDETDRAEAVMRETIHHEVIHAHFYESGLWSSTGPTENWSMDEQMIDWFSIQWQKINSSLRECGAMI